MNPLKTELLPLDWVAEYEIPPLRAIYFEYFDCSDTNEEIRDWFRDNPPKKIRRLYRFKDK